MKTRAWPLAVCAAALVLASVAAQSPARAQSFAFAGETVISGRPVNPVLTGVAPGARVEITAERNGTPPFGGGPVLYRSRAVFTADARGTVDLTAAAPVEGDYEGADGRGLFWSMKATRDPAQADAPAGQVVFTARVDGAPVATGRVRVLRADPAVVTTPVGDALPGAVFASLPGSEKRPVVILLGGSEGGSFVARTYAGKFASEGFAVLGLSYYSPQWGPQPQEIPGLPRSFVDIDASYLERALEWLRTRPEADVERIGVYGASKGAEYAAIAASRLSWLDAVVAVVPSDVVWEGWGPDSAGPGRSSSFAWKGEPLPFVPYLGMEAAFARMAQGRPANLAPPHAAGRAARPDLAIAARIPVERFRGPMMVIGGGRDDVWPSGPMAQNIAETRTRAGLTTEVRIYPEAGHNLSGDGYAPGTAAVDAAAQGDAWPATIAFLKRHLGAPRAR